MSFKSAEGSKFIDVETSYVSFPTAQGVVAFPTGLTAGSTNQLSVASNGVITAPEFKVATSVYLASTGVEAPLVNCGDYLCTGESESLSFKLTDSGGGAITFEDGSVQSTAYLGLPSTIAPIVYNQPVGPSTASGATVNLFFNQTFVAGAVYACSVSVECKADVGGQSLDDYKVALSYNNVDLCRTEIYGVGDADSIVAIPMTGFFKAIDPSTTLIKCAVTCTTSGGGTWNITADTILNLVRIA
jgi:hypothetical protein